MLNVNVMKFSYIFIAAMDYAGLQTQILSEELVIDKSKPIDGEVKLRKTVHRSNWITSNVVSISLSKFDDKESGIDYFTASIGSFEYADDVMSELKFNADLLEITLNGDLCIDGHAYFLAIKVSFNTNFQQILS